MNRFRLSAFAALLLLVQGCASTKTEYNIVIPRSGAPVVAEDDADAPARRGGEVEPHFTALEHERFRHEPRPGVGRVPRDEAVHANGVAV